MNVRTKHSQAFHETVLIQKEQGTVKRSDTRIRAAHCIKLFCPRNIISHRDFPVVGSFRAVERVARLSLSVALPLGINFSGARSWQPLEHRRSLASFSLSVLRRSRTTRYRSYFKRPRASLSQAHCIHVVCHVAQCTSSYLA